MIRINLSSLAPAKTKRGGKRASAPTLSMPGEGPSIVLMLLIAVAATAVICYLLQLQVNQKTAQLEKDMKQAQAENQRLAVVKAQYEASRKKADVFERRVHVIDELKQNQRGPVDVLNLVADTVNKTDAVWLNSMTSDGHSLDFIGMALSADAVADLMSNLRKTGAFKTVEIKETSQDSSVKELQAFKFELVCEIGFSGKVQKS
jgi:Tfp pilus assembly protein PilN